MTDPVDPLEAIPGRMKGEWLVTERRRMDRCEHSWLMALAHHDDSKAWEDEGQYSCAHWLTWRVGMARSTAYEKVRVELIRRPVINDAYAQGRISYSAARLITSLDTATPETDSSLVNLAEYGHISDLERAVRIYQRTEDQGLGRGLERDERRGVRIRKGLDGLGQLCATLTNAELDEIDRLLKMYTDPCAEEGDGEQSAPADSSTKTATFLSLEERLAGLSRAFGGGAREAGSSATADSSTTPAGWGAGSSKAGPSATCITWPPGRRTVPPTWKTGHCSAGGTTAWCTPGGGRRATPMAPSSSSTPSAGRWAGPGRRGRCPWWHDWAPPAGHLRGRLDRPGAMMLGVRITVPLDDGLYREVKVIAARTGRSVGAVIVDAIRAQLAGAVHSETQLSSLPTSGRGGLMQGVDLADSRATRDLLDEGVPLDGCR